MEIQNCWNVFFTSDPNQIFFIKTNFVIVHELDEQSPLAKFSSEELKELDAEFYILLQYHDEAFSQKLFKIYSYKFSQLEVDMTFVPSFMFDEEGNTLLDHDKLDQLKEHRS